MPSGKPPVDYPGSTAGKLPVADLPAFIFPQPQSAGITIAALSLLDRLIVALHRSGAGPITIISTAPLPPLHRSRALAIPFHVASAASAMEGPALIASTDLLVQPGDIRRCIESHSRLLSNAGEPLPIGVIANATSLPNAYSDSDLDHLPALTANGVAHRVNDDATARSAERALWASLTSSSDGFVDKVFNRPCGRPLSKILIHTPVTPNMVSVTSILLGVLSAYFFALGTSPAVVIGAILFQISAIIDCVDGDIARVVFKESPLGKWIDLAGDQIVHVSVFAGIALGVAKTSGAPSLLWLGVSAVIGALLSFAVILRGMRSPSGPGTLLKRLIDAATNRDFSVLVLLLACFGRLELFLWMAAIGSHIFWLAALSIQLAARQPRKAASGLEPGL